MYVAQTAHVLLAVSTDQPLSRIIVAIIPLFLMSLDFAPSILLNPSQVDLLTCARRVFEVDPF